MKNNQIKSFTFKVAQKTENQSPIKARDGVAIAGCTGVMTSWGPEARMNWTPAGHTIRDAGYWC